MGDAFQGFLRTLSTDPDGYALDAFKQMSTGRNPQALALLLDDSVSRIITWDLRTRRVRFKGDKAWKVSDSLQFGLSRSVLAKLAPQIAKVETRIRLFNGSRFGMSALAELLYGAPGSDRALGQEFERLPATLARYRDFLRRAQTPRQEEREARGSLIRVIAFLDREPPETTYSLNQLGGVLNYLYRSRVRAMASESKSTKLGLEARFESPTLRKLQREVRRER